MILTSEYNKGIISHIKSVTLTFDDLREIVVNCITDYDMEFNRFESSYVELAHCEIDKDIITKYIENINIKHMHIALVIFDAKTCKKVASHLDIPCEMKIVALKYKGTPEFISNCHIRLEGSCE